MKYNITPGELVAEIRMERAAYFSGPIVMVEALDDKKFWQAFFDLRKCRLVMSHGKETALAAYDLLEMLEEADKILVLIDDDFDSMLGRRRVAEAIVYTDAHDIEAVLLRSNALGRVICENVDSSIAAKFEQMLGRSIRDTLIERTVPLGRIRFCAQRDQWSVSFKKLTCFSLYDSANCSLDENKLLYFVLQQTSDVSVPTVKAALETDLTYDPWFLCHGGDVLTVFCILLAGPLRAAKIGPEKIFAQLRLAFTSADLKATAMYGAITNWTRRNSTSIFLI